MRNPSDHQGDSCQVSESHDNSRQSAAIPNNEIRRLSQMPQLGKRGKLLASLAERPWQTLRELQYTWNMSDINAIAAIHELMHEGLVECYANGRTLVFGLPNRPLERGGFTPFFLEQK